MLDLINNLGQVILTLLNFHAILEHDKFRRLIFGSHPPRQFRIHIEWKRSLAHHHEYRDQPWATSWNVPALPSRSFDLCDGSVTLTSSTLLQQDAANCGAGASGKSPGNGGDALGGAIAAVNSVVSLGPGVLAIRDFEAAGKGGAGGGAGGGLIDFFLGGDDRRANREQEQGEDTLHGSPH